MRYFKFCGILLISLLKKVMGADEIIYVSYNNLSLPKLPGKWMDEQIAKSSYFASGL